MKKITEIKGKLKKNPIGTLSKDELQKYFKYRLENLLYKKRVLVFDELKYLMCETGPGNLRLDPQIVSELTQEDFFVTTQPLSKEDLQKPLKKKLFAANYIQQNRDSEFTQSLIRKIISNYLKHTTVKSVNPFIINGDFKKIPVTCLIKNGEWIYPDQNLFSFLKEAKKENRQPIIIAKKISAILFPIFKALAVFGVNTYRTYLPEEGKKIIEDVSLVETYSYFDTSYNGQFDFLNDLILKDFNDPFWNGDLLISFFEKTLPMNIESYFNTFSNPKKQVDDDFLSTASKLRKNKLTKKIMENFKTREALLESFASEKFTSSLSCQAITPSIGSARGGEA